MSSTSGRSQRALRRTTGHAHLEPVESTGSIRTASAPPYLAHPKRRIDMIQALETKGRPGRASTISPTGVRKQPLKPAESNASEDSFVVTDQSPAIAQQMQVLEERYTRLAEALIKAELCYTDSTLQTIERDSCPALSTVLVEAEQLRDPRIAQAKRRHALACQQEEIRWQAQKQAAHVAYISRRGEVRMRIRQGLSAEILKVGREYEEMMRAEAPGMQLAPELVEQIQRRPVRDRRGPRGANRAEQDEDFLVMGLQPTQRVMTRPASPEILATSPIRRRKRRADSTLLPYVRLRSRTPETRQTGPLPSMTQVLQRETIAAHDAMADEGEEVEEAQKAPKPKLHHTYFMPASSQPPSRFATPRPSRPSSPSGYSYPYASAATASRAQSRVVSPVQKRSRDLWAKTTMAVPVSGTVTPDREGGASAAIIPDRRVSVPWELPH
ncbi:hypothetical protein BCR37DRAFT_388257 [Protomyces lactucae-debilis]|uniref:Sds3-like-domain-containing protein n=1 Tax=Protomyces lactucae-debilis TaxID=2754530 RepID=A0A1Y2FAD9_PROLT|nr:uncharacterized protein BCR37DRAFT_388257 [Protomyces lactucae-debilis]ORY79835.1 hypothetical protein BCR37DRAFT_388257 [Protomyces lactucae-debilis]